LDARGAQGRAANWVRPRRPGRASRGRSGVRRGSRAERPVRRGGRVAAWLGRVG